MANNIKGSASSGNTLVRSEQLNAEIVEVVKEYWEGGSFGHGLSIDGTYDSMFKVANLAKAEIATRTAESGAATTDRAALRSEAATESGLRIAAEATIQADVDANEAAHVAADGVATTDRAALRSEAATESGLRIAAEAALQADVDQNESDADASIAAATTDRAAVRSEFDAADVLLGLRADAIEASYRQFAQSITVAGSMTKDLTSGLDSAKAVLDMSIQIYLNGLRLHLDANATSDGTCTGGDYWYDGISNEIHVVDVLSGDMVEVQWNLI